MQYVKKAKQQQQQRKKQTTKHHNQNLIPFTFFPGLQKHNELSWTEITS